MQDLGGHGKDLAFTLTCTPNPRPEQTLPEANLCARLWEVKRQHEADLAYP